jgi:branched-chain amino acid transport system permease protein
MALALALLVAIWLVQSRTRFGLIARAVIQNPDLAGAVGININSVYRATFATGAALAAVAGVLLAPTVNVFPDMGPAFVISAFLAVLVGGLGSLRGLVLAVVLLGTSQYALAQIFTPVVGVIGLLLISIAALRFLPDGLGRVIP